MIHVCYGLYDKDGRYSKFCGTSIASIFSNTTEEVTIHILHDNTLTNDNLNKFNQLAVQYRQTIKFYNVETLAAQKLKEVNKIFETISSSPFTIGTMYRLIITEIISNEVGKIIYLDAGDTIVHCDVKNLWDIDINEYSCAAVPEVLNGSTPDKFLPMVINGIIKKNDYFNAGVMVLNLNYLRNNGFSTVDKFADFPKKYSTYMTLFDQDLLNYHFSTNYVKLPQNFNAFVRYERPKNKAVEQKIYHYTGRENACRPEFDISERFNKLFLEYFYKTPWFGFETLGNIANSIRKHCNQRQNEFLKISNILIQRERAFFADKRYVEILKKIFQIKDDEEFVDFAELTVPYVINLMKAMTASRGKKIFFIVLTDNYDPVRDLLVKNGFVEYVDFFNATKIMLSENQGVHFNSNFIIRDM